MSTIAKQLAYTSAAVGDIQLAITEKGVAMSDDIPLGDYGNKIREILAMIYPSFAILNLNTNFYHVTAPHSVSAGFAEHTLEAK